MIHPLYLWVITSPTHTIGIFCPLLQSIPLYSLADIARKKPLRRINDVLIMGNNNLVPVDFFVLDIDCNASCPIILERPFLRTVGAIIDMKEGTIRYQFPLKKGMEHFPRKRKKLAFDSIIRTNYDVDASSLENT
jgi:hypothetical protein